MNPKFKAGDIAYNIIINYDEEFVIFKNVINKVIYNEKEGFTYVVSEEGINDKKYRFEEKELYSKEEVVKQFNFFVKWN